MTSPPALLEFVADRGDARRRLDQVLVRHAGSISRMSRTQAQQWIKSGTVTIDGTPALRPASQVGEGAVVTVTLPDSTQRKHAPEPEALNLDILYEDEWLIVINKPAGIVVHPTYKNNCGTLLNGLLWRLRARPDARLGFINRLDKGTSGVIVAAIGAGVHARMQRAATAGRITKEYLAVVRGTPSPSSGVIELPLARDPQDRRLVITTAAGKPSRTAYQVVSTNGEHSMVRCELMTGRTHQIRVHLAASGWPIAGDATYGVPDRLFSGQALHASRISFAHPASGEFLQLDAPLPEEFARALNAYGLGRSPADGNLTERP